MYLWKLSFYLPILILIAGCNKNCFESWVSRKTKQEIHISNRITTGELDNGVKYFFMRNESPKDTCLLRLNLSVGSSSESDDELGMAHFVEHLAFDDRAVSKDESLADWFQKHGMSLGPDANAQTGLDNTVYQIDLPHCDKDSLTDAFSILRSFARGLQFKEASIAKEMNIIDAEEREYKNTQSKLSERLIENLYSGTALVSRPVLGKQEIRAKFSEESIKAFYDAWYQPQNFTVVLVGDYGDIKPLDFIQDAFSNLDKSLNAKKPVRPLNPDYKLPVFIVHEQEMPYIETAFSIQAKKVIKPKFSRALLKERMAFDLALSMLRHRYNAESRKTEDSLRETSINGFMLDRGSYELTLSIVGQENNFEQLFMDAYLALKTAATKGFSQEDFDNARSAHAESVAQWVLTEDTSTSYDWTDRIIGHIQQKWFANDASDYVEWTKPLLDQLRPVDCQNALKYALRSGNHYIFALGALEETEANVKRLTTLLDKAKDQPLAKSLAPANVKFAYEVADCGEEGATLEIGILEGVERVILKNKMEVLLKKTTTRTDEILLRIFSDEGYDFMDKKDFTISRLASAVLPEGGLTKHPPEQIPDLLRDKNLSVRLGLLDNRIQANIATRKKDLRFALEYMRAYVDDPLYSEASLNRIKERVKVGYRELEHDMWAPLQNDFLKELTGNDFRVGRASLEDMLAITRADLLDWHERHIRSRKLTVVAIGDFDREVLINDLNCVFGSLPDRPRYEGTRNAPLQFKAGLNKTYNVKTKDETSKLVLRYSLNKPGKIYPDHRLAILKGVIRENLREKLREKKQVTYSPECEITEVNDTRGQNWLDIVLSVPKNEAEKLRNKAKSVLDKLAKKGTTVNEFAKAKEPYLAHMTKLLNENYYWAEIVASQTANGRSLSFLSTIKSDIDAIKVSDINALLRQYLKANNASTAVVNATDG